MENFETENYSFFVTLWRSRCNRGCTCAAGHTGLDANCLHGPGNARKLWSIKVRSLH